MLAIRRGAGWAHLALALLVALGVFAQVYLIGAYIFGAGTGASMPIETSASPSMPSRC